MKTIAKFTEEYYERGKETGVSCYENYRWLPELTIPMAESLVANLGIKKTDRILDYGCAKGYLVKAFRGLGYTACGIDISEYAIAQADEEMRAFVSVGEHIAGCWEWCIAKDVLEHTTEEECGEILRHMRQHCVNLFIAVPLGNNGLYTIPEMEKDVTHVIRRPLWWWTTAVEEAGFKIYDSGFKMKGIKENWTRRFPFGNGFVTGK